MSKQLHTSLPCKRCYSKNTAMTKERIVISRELICLDCGHEDDCTYTGTIEIAESHQRLMMAAPDLLESLQKLSNACGVSQATTAILAGAFLENDSLAFSTENLTSNLALDGTYLFDVNYPAKQASELNVVGNLSGTGILKLQSSTGAEIFGEAIQILAWTGTNTSTLSYSGLSAGQSIVRWGNAYYLVPELPSFVILIFGAWFLLRRPRRNPSSIKGQK